ncbi:hypothetical protein FRB95_003684 [Tulasnella sp. JGI-2019a]|nr:hypothetical protein FRB95_003684 [Tulasnella sp. JGI-2019a]
MHNRRVYSLLQSEQRDLYWQPQAILVSNVFTTLLRNCRGTMLEIISFDGAMVNEVSVFVLYLHCINPVLLFTRNYGYFTAYMIYGPPSNLPDCRTSDEWDGALQQWETIRYLSTL